MTLTDTGPLVALLSQRDNHHARCAGLMPRLSLPLITTWPCLSEAMHLLGRQGGHQLQDKLWAYLDAGVLELHLSDESERLQMRALMNQYRDTPMDLADASLVAAAIALNTRRVFMLDSDFYVYRASGGASFDVLP